MSDLLFATNNHHKLREIQEILGHEFRILSLRDFNLDTDIPETQETLEGNALQKARFIHERTGMNCFADDTGLEIDALNGRPGVYSARYAGEGCSFDDNNGKILEELDGIDPAQVCVMVSNHQSGLDILVLFKLHRPFKWVAKKNLFTVPFIGWNMALNGYISIERGRGRSKLQMMDKAADSIYAGNSVLIFPEGTRSADGKLQTYKTGAFRLALETHSPILPIVIKGTHHTVRKGQNFFRSICNSTCFPLLMEIPYSPESPPATMATFNISSIF